MSRNYSAELSKVIAARPAEGLATTIPAERVIAAHRQNLPESGELPLAAVISQARGDFRIGYRDWALTRTLGLAHLDVIETLMKGRRSESLIRLWQEHLLPLRGLSEGEWDIAARRAYTNFSYPTDKIGYALRPSHLLSYSIRHNVQEWAQAFSSGPNNEALTELVVEALVTRLGGYTPKVYLPDAEALLVLGRRQFRVNVHTLSIEVVEYPAPKPGEQFTDGKDTFLIAQNDAGAVNLKTGVLLALQGGAPEGRALGETFFRVGE